MISTLIDAGPLIALFDKDDAFHERMVECVRTYSGIFVSTWPVITEAMHILRRYHLNQRSLLQWIEAGGIRIIEITRDDLAEMIKIFESIVMYRWILLIAQLCILPRPTKSSMC